MNELEKYLQASDKLWHNSTYLISLFGRNQLNELYKQNKIVVQEGLNKKVVKYEK